MNAQTVFDNLATYLIKAVPRAISGRVKQPICALRLFYYDTHAPCCYVLAKPVLATFRDKIMAEKDRSALYYFWSSSEGKGLHRDVSIGTGFFEKRHFRPVYQLLGESERKNMRLLRQTLHQVCRKLNEQSWEKICPVTDDFAVVAADGSQFFADDAADIEGSLPPERVRLLQERGLLGPSGKWMNRPGYVYVDP